MGTLSTEKVAIKNQIMESMPERIKKLRHCALFDLHFGPHSAEYYKDSAEFEGWPGYVSALHELEEWADLNLSELWVDEDGCISDTEPQGETIDGTWVEPCGYAHYDRKAVKTIVFDKLVTDGGMN